MGIWQAGTALLFLLRMGSIPAKLTPMLSQYLEIKKRYSDSLLFFRMGDFYEMFFDDAETAAPVLEVALTARDKQAENPIPMCGVPHHALNGYLQKLVSAGHKVAICEQMEDPAAAKGIVKRDVIRVVTPSLVGDPDLVPEATRNFLLAARSREGRLWDVALLELLGGQMGFQDGISERQLGDLLWEFRPKEILIAPEDRTASWLSEARKVFSDLTVTSRDTLLSSSPKDAVGLYVQETQKQDASAWLKEALPLFSGANLKLDPVAAEALELVPLSGARKGNTLFEVLDHGRTSMGRRLLRDWLLHPLTNLNEIEKRHEAVEYLVSNSLVQESFDALLKQQRDLERLATKTALKLSMPRDLLAVRSSLEKLPRMQELLLRSKSERLNELGRQIDLLPELLAELDRALLDEPAAGIRDGGIFRESYHPEIGDLRKLSADAKGFLAEMEARERKSTGISSLKIRFSKVFGYTIEITKSHVEKVPAHYIRKQTIANGERYITEELKTFEERVLTADHKIRQLEEGLFNALREHVAAEVPALLRIARVIAELDVLLGFAEAAQSNQYIRPKLHSGWDLEITEGRHPVVEKLLPSGKFVPNSLRFSPEEQTWIITGPNMAGKSTIMRQVAITALMAQAGSFVPARAASLPILDAVFTRIGSSDDLSAGRSTFMVEMTEVSQILKRATPRSLILIDEIGRGTSTYDGLSLAWSVLEYLHRDIGAKTLFATHFHEITQVQKLLPGVMNAHVLVEKWKDEIVFLHKLSTGVCHQSYGIEVAKLAELPSKVLLRAREVLSHLETQSRRGEKFRSRALDLDTKQPGFFDGLTPLEMPSGLEH